MFNPSLHTATNKPIGLINKPVDARTYYYDEVNFVYRPYVSNAEVLAYLAGNQRVGQFSIIINTGGSVVNGVITGGTNAEWWFKNGIADSDLLFKGASGGTAWGEIGGDINDQTDLIELIETSVEGAIFPDLKFKIPIGTASPFYLEMGIYADYGLMPWVQKAIKDPESDGTRLRNFTDIEHDYIYTDDTETVLSAIEINGHLDDYGDNTFREDTWIVIKQNSPVLEIGPTGLAFYKVKNDTSFNLKYWNNYNFTNPDGDPLLADVHDLDPGSIATSVLLPLGEEGEDHAYFSGADDRTIDIWLNGVLTDSAVDIHDLVVFLTQAGPAVGGNYWVIKEHV